MNDSLKKNKSSESLIDEYMANITSNCEKNMTIVKKPVKISEENISIPTIINYNEMPRYNYNVNQLKLIAKNYKLKISGNKNQLLTRIYSFLYFSITSLQIPIHKDTSSLCISGITEMLFLIGCFPGKAQINLLLVNTISSSWCQNQFMLSIGYWFRYDIASWFLQ